ncbi:MAG: phosphoribosylglycinamide formyltransferase [bacterium JZ-2024 1]
MIRIGVLVSGRGTNLQAIIDACEDGRIPGKVVLVLSNNPEAYALTRAEKHRIPAFVIMDNSPDFEERLIQKLKEYQVDLVCLAGFMKILSGEFLAHFPHRVLNIHPALLPAFRGLEAQRRAWEHGVKIAGCTVHFVDEKMDHGPIILQAAVPVLEKDTPESLAERILKEEHRIYPEAIRLFAEGRLKIEGRKVRIEGVI